MNKAIVFILVVVALLVVGCAAQTQVVSKPVKKDAVKTTTGSTPTAPKEVDKTPTTESKGTETTKTETPTTKQTTDAPKTSKKLAVSQDDLDDLKKDLEGMEFEDLGGLSNK